MVQRESGTSRTLILYVAKSRLGTVLNSHSQSTFHRVWIKNQQLPKITELFFHAVSCCITRYYGYTQQSQTFPFHNLCDAAGAEGLTFRVLGSPTWWNHISQLCVSKGSLSTVKDPYGKSYQKLTGKCKKQKSICIFGSIFIASSQRHIQWGLRAIWGRDGEKRKRMSREHGSFSICWMQFLDFCNQTGIICIICNMQYRKSTILCRFI